MDTDPISAIVPAVRLDDRLTVRHRLDDGSATDVVGWVVAVDEGRIRIQPPSPDGAAPPVEVARERIILAKRVPPAMGGRAPTRVTPEELELAALPGWVADSKPLAGWTLRLGNGFTGRANSCLAVGDPGIGYDEAAQRIVDRYTAAGLEPRVQAIAGSEPDARLRDLGWQETYVATTVMAHTLNGLLEQQPPRHHQNRDHQSPDHQNDDQPDGDQPDGDQPDGARVRIATELTEDWWQGYLQYRPIPDHSTARRILTNNPPVGLASIRSGARKSSEIVALGRGQVTRDWLGIAGLWTEPGHRRKGLATMIIVELARWAARRGARNVYLQVAKENAGAIAAYRRLGFTAHHDYLYLRPPAH